MTQETFDKLMAFFAILGAVACLLGVAHILLQARSKRRGEVEPTPVAQEGLAQYDDFPPGYAVALAWSEPGDNPRWHQKMQDEVRSQMPVLARNLDRLVAE